MDATLPLSPAWQSCLSAWLQSVYDRSGSERSRVVYRNQIMRFLAFVGKSPEQVTRSDVRAYISQVSHGNRRRGEPVAASTHNSRLTAIASFYRFSSNFDIEGEPLFTKALPTTGIPYLKVGFNYRYMTDAEVTRFFESIDRSTIKGRRDFCLFLAYFICARRRSELVSLRFRDLEQTVIVGNDGTRHDGWVYRFQGAKGHARQTFMFEMPKIVIDHILDYLTFAGRLKTMKPDDPVFAPIFPGQGRRASKKNEPLSGNYINGLFRQYCTKAGLDSHFTLHSLRHSSARARYKAGASLQSIQHLLLHSNIGITDLYLRTLAGVADPEARLLEQWFSHLGKL